MLVGDCMKNLRRPLRWIGCLTVGLAFVFPVIAQQEGPMPPAERQAPVPPSPAPAQQPPAPPPAAPQTPAAAQSPATSNSPGLIDPAQPAPPAAPAPPKPGSKVEIPTGTRIPLVLHNGISTHSSKPGDPVYFETLFPIMIDGRVAIPAGSYVSGE